jgi:short-subunit dehydrogenase
MARDGSRDKPGHQEIGGIDPRGYAGLRPGKLSPLHRKERAMTFPLRDGVAVVTGAASGIGAALALQLARRGCRLALLDRDRDALAAAASAARKAGVAVSEHPADVADPAVPEALREAVLAEHGRASILINNAGVALLGRFEQISLADMEWLFAINFWGTVRMCKAFLPALRQQPDAQIVNLSSIFGIVAPAGQTAYAASKFAVRGFSEALMHELEDTGIGVSVVHPGYVKTAIARNARVAAGIDPQDAAERIANFDRMTGSSPEQAAARIVAGIERRRKRILIGADAARIDWMQRILPISHWELMKRRAVRRAAATP